MARVQHLIGRHLWVKRDPAWNAVMETIALPLFSDPERDALLQWIDLERRQIDWDAIHRTAEQFSEEQRILLRIAHALFNEGPCQLWELGRMSSRGRSAAMMIIGLRYL
ncbi:MAG: hypothetical protein K6U14_01665 [Firmicutes bacterium]|nr:hypothetical protein [Alicyclobacillaceae bacterium]MCL6496326.1 hypothetical protein [Bacillota bacterium]